MHKIFSLPPVVSLIIKAWMLFFLICNSCRASAFAEESTKITEKSGQAPEMIILVVDKKNLHADLVAWPEPQQFPKLLKTFPIAVGKAEGDKQVEGDNKTPEGIYFTRKIIDGDSLPDKYGPKAIPIDFPNPVDSMLGKTGHGIWLHGAGDDERIKASRVTEGCVAFFNRDIEKLTNWLQPHQGVVVIADDATNVNRKEEWERVTKRTQDWLSSWNARKLDSYISFYDKVFFGSKGDIKAYKAYKKRVFSQYKRMEAAGDTLRVITHPRYAISIMNQVFRGDQFFSDKGRKILYWKKSPESGEWYIIREVFENRKVKLFQFTEQEIALLSDDTPGYPSYSEKKKNSFPKL